MNREEKVTEVEELSGKFKKANGISRADRAGTQKDNQKRRFYKNNRFCHKRIKQ